MFKMLMALSFITGCYASSIKVIGLSEDSKITMGEMSSAVYADTLVATKEAFDQQVIKGLESYQDKSGWKLSKVSLGISARGTIGIGPFQWGQTLKERFGYVR